VGIANCFLPSIMSKFCIQYVEEDKLQLHFFQNDHRNYDIVDMNNPSVKQV
jgi:hypothetical protein